MEWKPELVHQYGPSCMSCPQEQVLICLHAVSTLFMVSQKSELYDAFHCWEEMYQDFKWR